MSQGGRRMPMLNSCCGCASLKVGTIISGALGVVIGAVTLVYVLLGDVKLQMIVIDSLPENIVKIILAINLVMTMLISVLLIIGALKRNRFMMLPWVILAIMLAVGLAISVIYTAVVFFLDKHVIGGVLWVILWLLLGFTCVAIYVYLWFVVYSYYQLLEEEKGRGPYSRPAYRR